MTKQDLDVSTITPTIPAESGLSSKPKKRNDWLSFERNEILLLISYFLYGVAFANYEPYAPIWLSQFFSEDSFLIIGFVVVIPSLIGALALPLWGFLADKYGAKIFVIVGFIAFGLMFIALQFTVSSTYFLVMILVGYLIGSATLNNIFVLGTRTISKPKEVVFAKFTITASLAFVILSPLVGWIYDSFANSMMIQLIIASAAILIASIIILFVKDKKNQIPKEMEANVESNQKSPLTSVPLIFTVLMVLTFIFQSSAGFWAYSSIYFLDTVKVKGIYFSVFIIVKTALAVPLSFLFGRVKTKGTMGIILSSFTGYFIFVFILMVIFPTNWILLIIFYCLPMYPIYNVFLYGLTASYSSKTRRGTAFGLFGTIGTLGYVTGILVLGSIADAWNSGTYAGVLSMFPISLIFASLTFIIAFLFYLFVLRKDNIIEKDAVSKN